MSGFALLVLAAMPAWAEPIGSHIYLSPAGGYTSFDPDDRFGAPTGLVDGPYVGGRLGYQWSRLLGIEGAAGFTGTHEDRPGGADVNWFHGSLDVVFSPFGTRFTPFLLVGGGASRFKLSDGASDAHGNAVVGLGARYWLNDRFGLRLDARDLMHVPKDDPANIESHTLVIGAGLTFAVSARPRDMDGDDVPDRADRCPGTPAGVRVDAVGCPLDTDGDAVFDGLDQCEGTLRGAVVDARGCAVDTDRDSIPDGIDQCEGTPPGARVDPRGCPLDADGDGIADGVDQCPDTPRPARVDVQGCPIDVDGDGVPDGIDDCPATPIGTRVDASGCPTASMERESELLDTGVMVLEGVQFEAGRSTLGRGEQHTLNVAGEVLGRRPDLKIEIGVHTDGRGTAAANQRLSQMRARAVLDYLVQKYPTLKRGQFTLRGYGESRPLVPEGSETGRSRNRRVELKVLNRDALRRDPAAPSKRTR